ncbi:TetR/AcrR family transcriptional regulator [Mycolicibacterium hodleri]|uniref:TetR/AcrR family transcriptional regulator n=1 Tax=Mycolicibacterium hodleri TaxID=49897 RepID=UPI001375E3C6|nr:TetR/AcrR family transcriptional regulator [Mycolicibacterium hodleri]
MKRTTRPLPAPATRDVGWAAGPRADKTRRAILDTANRLFLESGYSCVRVEDIASAAEISRSLFYIYFPSKRDVFLAIGIDSIAAGTKVLDVLDTISENYDDDDLREWIGTYLEYLEHFGAFIRSWDEAMANDQELQRDSQRRTERFCRRMGLALDRLRGASVGDPTLQGLALRSTIDGVWYFWRVSDLPHERDEIVAVLVVALKSAISR